MLREWAMLTVQFSANMLFLIKAYIAFRTMNAILGSDKIYSQIRIIPTMSQIVPVSKSGRINLPSAIRKKMGLAAGGAVLVNETDNGLVLQTVAQAIAKAQAIAEKRTASEIETSVDAFLAARRADSGE